MNIFKIRVFEIQHLFLKKYLGKLGLENRPSINALGTNKRKSYFDIMLLSLKVAYFYISTLQNRKAVEKLHTLAILLN